MGKKERMRCEADKNVRGRQITEGCRSNAGSDYLWPLDTELTLRRELPADRFEAVEDRGCIFAGDIDRVGTFDGPPSGPGDRRCIDRWDRVGACIFGLTL